MEGALAEYRNDELGLICNTKFSIVKINVKRLIDDTIINNSFRGLVKNLRTIK